MITTVSSSLFLFVSDIMTLIAVFFHVSIATTDDI